MASIASTFPQKKSGRSERLQRDSSGKHALTRAGDTSTTDVSQRDEEVLKAFDLTLKYGPCIGISRKERWERAQRFGLEPPHDVLQILDRVKDDSDHNKDIWYGRV